MDNIQRYPGNSTKLYLTGLIVICLFLRIFLSPVNGLKSDMRTNAGWAYSSAVQGIRTAYHQKTDPTIILPNHGAFELGLYQIVGTVNIRLFSARFQENPFLNVFLKIPFILADVLLLCLFFFLYKRIGSDREAMIAAAIFAIQPVILYQSALWGQTDCLVILMVVSCILALNFDLPLVAGLLFGAGIQTKPQFFIFIPIVLLLVTMQEKRKMIPLAIGFLLMEFLLFIPFMGELNFFEFLTFLPGIVSKTGKLSYNAFNVWVIAFGKDAFKLQDNSLLASLITYSTVGLALFASSYGLVLLRLFRYLRNKNNDIRNRMTAILMASATVNFLFFMFNTQMHERYNFGFSILALPLIFGNILQKMLYIGVSIAILLNEMKIYNPFFNLQMKEWYLSETFERVASLGNLILCIGACYAFVVLTRKEKQSLQLHTGFSKEAVMKVSKKAFHLYAIFIGAFFLWLLFR